MTQYWVLTRWGLLPDATVGTLSGPGFECITLERPWLGNEPFISCVPDGHYDLVPHKWRNKINSFAIVGGTVSHFEAPGYARHACCFHPANRSSQLQGCIAPGRAVTTSTQGLWITSSHDALLGWLGRVHPGDRLTIRYWGEVEFPTPRAMVA